MRALISLTLMGMLLTGCAVRSFVNAHRSKARTRPRSIATNGNAPRRRRAPPPRPTPTARA